MVHILQWNKILYQTLPISFKHIQYNSRIKSKDDLLDLPKTNDILCWTTTESSDPAVNVRRTSRGYAPLFGIHERWAPGDRVELTSPKSAKHIGAVFINKPQIWVLNGYILSWNTRVHWRQALAVTALAPRLVYTPLSRRNKATSASDRRPSAPRVLSSAGKLIRYLHGSYFLPYRSTDVFLFSFLSFCHSARLFTERSLLHITRRHAPYCWLAKSLFGIRPWKIAYPAFNVFICES